MPCAPGKVNYPNPLCQRKKSVKSLREGPDPQEFAGRNCRFSLQKLVSLFYHHLRGEERFSKNMAARRNFLARRCRFCLTTLTFKEWILETKVQQSEEYE